MFVREVLREGSTWSRGVSSRASLVRRPHQRHLPRHMARRLAAAVLIVCTSAAALASPLLSNARLSAALFDIDGTLFNSDALHLLAFQELLQEEGFNGGERISEAFFLENISGRQNSQIVRDLFPERTAAQGADFSDRKEAKFRELAAAELSGMVTPGLEALLGTLEARGVRCAAVTNAPRANAELMLGAIGRLGWFEPLIIGDECTAGKPDPEPYLRAMRELGVLPGECLAFEDSPSGARAAVAAGLRTVGITSTQPAAVLVEGAGCAYAIADFTETALAREVEERAGRVLLTRPKLWLLDRDGCLNIDVGAPGVVRLDQLQLLPGSAGALRRLRLAGPVAIITNQSGRGRGLLTAEGLEAIHERLRHLVATTARGGRVGREQWDGLYVCEDAHPSARKKPVRVYLRGRACADQRSP